MVNRVNGLYSGLDTEALVKAMTSNLTAKRDKVVKAQTTLEWKQEAWDNMNKDIKSYFNSNLAKSRYSSYYQKNGEYDVDTIKERAKEFVSSYNSILTEMQTAYYKDRNNSYEPLTDDEKESMTESQINKWEAKIKDSLLSHDSTLGGVINNYKNAISNSDLSSIGLTTSAYTIGGTASERGAIQIDEDSLMKAIEADPEGVAKKLSAAASNLYNNTTSKMAYRSGYSSGSTIYDDLYMKTQYNNYTTQISDWENKIADYEDKYYKQFSTMESALATLQSQMSYFSSYFSS